MESPIKGDPFAYSRDSNLYSVNDRDLLVSHPTRNQVGGV